MRFLLILLALVIGWYAWKAFSRERSRVARKVEAARLPPTETLEPDPKTGRYKVKGDE